MRFVGCPDDAGEHLLGVCAVASAIAAAELPGDDGGPEGLFGSPIGGVDRRLPKEGEHRREFDGQMRGESQPSESSEQSAAGRARPWSLRHPASRRSRNSKAACRNSFHPDDPPATWAVALQVPCPPEQVSQTCLVHRLGEAAIRRPGSYPGKRILTTEA